MSVDFQFNFSVRMNWRITFLEVLIKYETPLSNCVPDYPVVIEMVTYLKSFSTPPKWITHDLDL